MRNLNLARSIAREAFQTIDAAYKAMQQLSQEPNDVEEEKVCVMSQFVVFVFYLF